jgi:hypothetical protein
MPKKLKKNEYRCFICKEVFDKGWSDKEALEEFNTDFPTIPLEETEVICDFCYKMIKKDVKNNPWKYKGL